MLERLQAALAERYTVEREQGRGGMASVWLARDLRHGRAVALKVLRPELAGAIAWLRRYSPVEDLHFQLHLRCDPTFDRLRSDPGFRALLDRSLPPDCAR